MTRIILLLGLAALPSALCAELIKGPANIRLGPNKEIIVSLYDSVDVSCTPLRNGWYRISFSVKVTDELFNSHKGILKGEKLVDWNDRVIGVAVNDIPLSDSYSWTSGGAPGNPKRFGMEVFGFTHVENIYAASIPENRLNQILRDNKGNLNLSAFEDFHETFGFTNHGLLSKLSPSLTEYMIYENVIDDPSPLDRLRLIFEGQKLLAIVHTRELATTQSETVSIARDRLLTIFSLPANTTKKEFVDVNNRGYWGVD
jgi:hypothetical protein